MFLEKVSVLISRRVATGATEATGVSGAAGNVFWRGSPCLSRRKAGESGQPEENVPGSPGSLGNHGKRYSET